MAHSDLARLIARRADLLARDYDTECAADLARRLVAAGIPKAGLLTVEQEQTYRRVQQTCLAEYHQLRYAAMFEMQVIDDELAKHEQREAAA